MANSGDILLLYKQDERAALQKLFTVYYEPLLLYCYRLIREPESAEDIVQECFVHIWRSRRLENFEGELDRFMFQAVKFRAINYIIMLPEKNMIPRYSFWKRNLAKKLNYCIVRSVVSLTSVARYF